MQQWRTVNPTTKNILKDYIKQLVKSTSEIISRISKSILTSFEDPWKIYRCNFGATSTSEVIGKFKILINFSNKKNFKNSSRHYISRR